MPDISSAPLTAGHMPVNVTCEGIGSEHDWYCRIRTPHTEEILKDAVFCSIYYVLEGHTARDSKSN